MKPLILFILTLNCIVFSNCKTQNDLETKDIELSGTFITIPELPNCDPKNGKQLVQLPFLKNAWQLQEDCRLYERDEVTWTLITFYIEWKKQFGDPHGKVKKMINNITIVWDLKTTITGPIYTISGKRKEKAEVIGLCNSSSDIWVWVSDGQISHTALIHELVHAALWTLTSNPDADHEGNSEPGWTKAHTRFIIMINKSLNKKYGL